MTIKSIQKVIKVGDSLAVTIPAKDARHLHIEHGDELIVSYEKPQTPANSDVVVAAQDILKRYKKDFENLAKR